MVFVEWFVLYSDYIPFTQIKIKPTAIFIIGIIAYIFFRVYSHYGSVDNPQGICRLFAYIWEHHLFNVFGICNGLCYLSMGLLFAQKGTTKNKDGFLHFSYSVSCFPFQTEIEH